jgi:hypothetical protein
MCSCKKLACVLLGLVISAGCAARAQEEEIRSAESAPVEQRLTANNDNNLDTPEIQLDGKQINLAGKGRQASEKFFLQPGLGVFEIHHDGDSNLVVRLLDRDGKAVDTLFNQIGTFNGQRGFAIRQEGQYLLDVAADGNWTVAIRQPRPTEGQAVPRTLQGTGYDVTPFIQLDKGLNVFKMKHNGENRFTATLVDRDGRQVEPLINTLGHFDGSKPVSIEKPGIYFLNIGGDGQWTVDVQ